MPEVLDWQRGDPRVAAQRAVQELAAGRLVIVPADTGYHVAASALHEEARAALCRMGGVGKAVLAFRDDRDALQWAPWLPPTAQRLARRVWPGPVTIAVDFQHPQAGGRWFPHGDSTVRLRVPGHEAPLYIVDQLGSPLIARPLLGAPTSVPDMAAAFGHPVTLVIEDGRPDEHLAETVVTVCGNDWSVTETGAITEEMLRSLMPTTVVFVCTGNTCRSPMAEALCKKLLAERLGCQPNELAQRGFLVLSAGLAAMMGVEASPHAVQVAREMGADLSSHRSQSLGPDLLARADHLFTMTQSQLRVLEAYCRQGGPQPRLLAGDGRDIVDPIGAEPQVYRECAEQIHRHLQDCLADLQPL